MTTSEKHKNDTQEADSNKLKNSLQALSDSISEMSVKKQDIISDWFFTWARYLKFERTFKPERLKYYKRGDIVHVHFGFNVGNEQGGTHYAVVVDNNNNKASGCIVVVPISSIEKGKTADSLHGSEVYLGKIIPNSDTESYAQPLQIRCVSKLRIIKPKSDNDTNYILSAEQMDMIDNKIVELFTKRHLTNR